MLIEQITSDLISTLITQLKKKKNMQKVQLEIIDPIVSHAFRKLYPYMVITGVLFFLIFIIAFSLVVFVLHDTSTPKLPISIQHVGSVSVD